MATRQQVDPTQTKMIRKKYSADCYKRFRKLKGIINEAIIKKDILALKSGSSLLTQSKKLDTNFDFKKDWGKMENFNAWLKEQESLGELEILNGGRWQEPYVMSTYKKAQTRAATQLNQLGISTPSITEGAAGIFTMPVHMNSLLSLYTRNFQALEGVTSAMNKEISRTLATGLTQGKGPREIARMLNNRVDKIGITRARTMARTEIINVHAEATLNSYERHGVDEVGAEVEFSHTGDSKVCPTCLSLGGRVYKTKYAHGKIPVHPNCRCAWLPVVENAKGEKVTPKGPAKTKPAGQDRGLGPTKRTWETKYDNSDEIQEYIKKNADDLGLSVKEYKKQATEKMQKMVDDAQLRVRIGNKNLAEMIDDGKYKSQFETGKSGGLLDNDVRARVENKFFGTPMTQKSDRPIYGYLHKGDDIMDNAFVDHYGNTVIKLKDSVRDRTTVTFGDSLGLTDAGHYATAVPTPARNVTYKASRHRSINPFKMANVNDAYSYVEMQVQNGFSLDDIEKIIFKKNNPPSNSLLAQLRATSIDYEIKSAL